MKRAAIIALVSLAGAGLVAWLLLGGETWTFTVTQQQIEARLAERFPISKTYLVLFTVHYENPRVRLTDGSSDVQIGLDARIDGSVHGKELKGSADIATKIAYDATKGTFVMNDAKLVRLDIVGLKPEIAEQVKGIANLLATERISGVPIYTLKPTDVKTTLARLVLKSVSVRDGVLRVEVGL